MDRKHFSVILMLTSLSFFHAFSQTEGSGCFERFFQAGRIALDSLEFTKAELQFAAANECDDKPEDYRLSAWQDTIRFKYFYTLESAERARKAEQKALREKAKADSALNLANRIIDAFYFYKGRYAMAFKKIDEDYGKYGFINREGIPVIKYRYDEATPFDNYTGFAKVKREKKKYLIDTLGTEYLLAEEIDQLNGQIEALDLSDKSLDVFPPEIFLHPQLKILHIYQNQISELPPEIDQLTNLRTLDVSGNVFSTLPENIRKLESLVYLDLSTNKFQELPSYLEGLNQLSILKLSNNQLRQFPEFIRRMDSLRYLEMTGNPIARTDIELAAAGMPHAEIEFKDFGLALSEARNNKQETSGENLTSDAPFFEAQRERYQKWLDNTGIGNTLRVYELSVEPEQISLYLAFPFENPDSVVAAWRGLKENFGFTEGLSLEQQLFYQMTYFMEIAPTQGNVQIYDTYDLRKKPLFFRGIYSEDDQVKVESTNPRSSAGNIEINTGQPTIRTASVQKFSGYSSRELVFSRILQYVENRYDKNSCRNKSPEVRVLEKGEILRLEVAGLCQEVLDDDNIRARVEILNFTFSYEATSSGFELFTQVDGKYSTGIINSRRRGAYKDMELEFSDLLENYADSFKKSLRKALLIR